MSTIRVSINTQPLDFSPVILGAIKFKITYEGVTVDIVENLSYASGGYRYFKFINWVSPGVEPEQNLEYAQAIKRDYSKVFSIVRDGVEFSNIGVIAYPDEVVITARRGVFSDPEYTGNALNGVGFVIENTVQDTPKTFSYSNNETGDCTNVNYTANSATGGTGPYRLYAGGANLFTGWDGITPQPFQLERAKNYTGGLYDSNNLLIQSFSQIPPKKIESSDFKAYMTYYNGFGYADMTVETVVSRAGTTPLQYSLDNGPWQSSNLFGGVLTGIHNLRIRDRFLCEVSKTVEVFDSTSIDEEEREPYFTVSEYNSLSFYKDDKHSVNIRKNYKNTPSFKESVGLPKTAKFGFPISSTIATKFNSSYPYHNVTLHKWDGTKQNIQFFLIQENLRVAERVDCELFTVSEEYTAPDGTVTTVNDGIGVYFDGGNKYEPQTSTVIDDSPYESGLPSWAKKGNVVAIQGIGTKEIIATNLYDADRDVRYFKVEGTIPEQAGVVEAYFDRHPYNVYRFDFDMLDVHQEGNYIKIEPGYSFDEIDQRNTYKSEPFFVLNDTSKHIKIKWKGFKNLGEMIFLDNMESEMWVKGKVRPFPFGSSEYEDGDDQTRSINQESYLRMRATIPIMTPKQWRKFDLVGAIGSRGDVFIEDMKLTRIKSLEHDELGETNISNISCDFAYSGEGPIEGQQDPVLDVSTGETGTGGTGKEPVLNWEVDGFRLATEEGQLISVDGYFVAID